MSTAGSVLGVLGCAGFAFSTQHSGKPRARAFGACLCWVCWVLRARARACAIFCRGKAGGQHEGNFSHARPEKPSKPSTLSTTTEKALILKGFFCAGFVLGWGFLCWVGFLGGAA